MFDHHHPLVADYYTIVLGFSAVILICLFFFILYLRIGLQSQDSVVIDTKANSFAPNEKALDGHLHH